MPYYLDMSNALNVLESAAKDVAASHGLTMDQARIAIKLALAELSLRMEAARAAK